MLDNVYLEQCKTFHTASVITIREQDDLCGTQHQLIKSIAAVHIYYDSYEKNLKK